jgi:hypothetical protein
MARRSGTADLPLHGGHAPRWLFERMTRLAPAIVEAIVLDRGPAAVLERLSDPFWFQAFGCVLGFDWHSSGVTTTVCGALKQGLAGREADIGIMVAGGKGRTSRRTPEELRGHASRLGLDGEALVYNSRMSAKVDSAAVQDGFQIYHHAFFLTSDGGWAVVQQGMREGDSAARRYHWLGARVHDFVCEPHAAICSDARAQTVLDLTAADSAASRIASAELSRQPPDLLLKQLDRALALHLPDRHRVDIRQDVHPRNLRTVLITTYENAPADFESLLALPGVGAKAIRALALMSELIHGAPAAARDPARFSFAHGGKDGHPFPVDRPTYDLSIEFLRQAVARAKVGQTDRAGALRRLAAWQNEQA